MKTLSALSIGLALMTVVSTGCNKCDNENKMYDVSFFTGKSQGALTLYIDDVEKGPLGYFATTPECGQQFKDGPQPLRFQLPAGTYSISGRNAQGQVTTSAKVTLRKETKGASGSIGGMSISSTESCVTIGLFE